MDSDVSQICHLNNIGHSSLPIFACSLKQCFWMRINCETLS